MSLEEITSRESIENTKAHRFAVESASSAVEILKAVRGSSNLMIERASASLTVDSSIQKIKTALLPILQDIENQVIQLQTPHALEDCEKLLGKLKHLLSTLEKAVDIYDADYQRESGELVWVWDINQESHDLYCLLSGVFDKHAAAMPAEPPANWKELITAAAQATIAKLEAEAQRYHDVIATPHS